METPEIWGVGFIWSVRNVCILACHLGLTSEKMKEMKSQNKEHSYPNLDI